MKVIQTWDDGIVDDVRLVEILRGHNARATFCLNPGLYGRERSLGWIHENKEVWRLSIGELPHVYEGLEVCSHSMTHPYLTHLPAELLDWEVTASRDMLQEIFRKPVLGFCYPFNTWNEVVKAALRSAGYLWARGGHDNAGLFPPRDPLEFNFSCHFLSPDFWPMFDAAKERNSVFSFWGHSFEMANDAMWQDFEGTLKKISEDQDAEWSFVNDLFV
ncbi:MAG TPA: polysaccharide deacetylase family protein [Syntrophales bacterium]|nr:polysaccharide deacetylase family protein [Syntrophales bacterium]